VAEATGQTARFLKVYEEYKKAPEVTRKRMYLETMERVLGGADKIIIDSKRAAGVSCRSCRSTSCRRAKRAASDAALAPWHESGEPARLAAVNRFGVRGRKSPWRQNLPAPLMRFDREE
jgi:hypothetical protein